MKRSKKNQQRQKGTASAGQPGQREVLVTGFIDVDLWNRAGWQGVGYMGDPNGGIPPMMALLFDNETAARKIFEGWHKRLGKEDRFEELRISIIEGDIPGKDPGYTVFISANVEGVKKHFELIGQPFDGNTFMIVSRIHHMNPAPNSPHLPKFKADFARHGVYGLAPMILKGGAPVALLELAITKREVHFRRVEDIGEHDEDRPAFGGKPPSN